MRADTKHYIIVEVDGCIHATINKKNKADKYDDPKEFGSRNAAMAWIKRHSYKGMSHHYEIYAVPIDDSALKCIYNQKEDKTEWGKLLKS